MIPIGRGSVNSSSATARPARRPWPGHHPQPEGGDVVCVYVAIGQKESTVAGAWTRCARTAPWNTPIVVTSAASDPAPLQYLAVLRCTMAEYFMFNYGRDTLVIYDDCPSSHGLPATVAAARRPREEKRIPTSSTSIRACWNVAASWRRSSSSLRPTRPLRQGSQRRGREGVRAPRRPGRGKKEAGIHARKDRLKVTSWVIGRSMTPCPSVDDAGRRKCSAYIPTNVISITEPARSTWSRACSMPHPPGRERRHLVSRVGGNAQVKAMKAGGRLAR